MIKPMITLDEFFTAATGIDAALWDERSVSASKIAPGDYLLFKNTLLSGSDGFHGFDNLAAALNLDPNTLDLDLGSKMENSAISIANAIDDYIMKGVISGNPKYKAIQKVAIGFLPPIHLIQLLPRSKRLIFSKQVANNIFMIYKSLVDNLLPHDQVADKTAAYAPKGAKSVVNMKKDLPKKRQ